MMAWLYLIVLAIYAIHTFLDCACTIVTLFYSSSSSKSDLCFIVPETVEHSNSGNNENIDCKKEEEKSKIRQVKAMFLGLYPSLFKDPILEEHPAILSRILMYWIAAMGLTRLMAICWTCAPTLITVAIMYALEALAIEYEGFTFQTAKSEYARKVSLFSFGMCIVSCLMAIFIPS
jgi:hypothetical protein